MHKSDKNTQSDKFENAAREAGADESEDAFKARLRKIAKAKLKDDPPPEPDVKSKKQKPGR